MKLINITFYTFLRNIRDYRMMLFLIVLPIILIVVLGSTLEHEFSPTDLGKVTVVYLNEDTGFVGESFTKFMQSENIKEIVEVKNIGRYTEGVAQLNENNIEAFVYVPKEASKKVDAGEQVNIQIKSNNQFTLVKALISNYINTWNSNEVIYSINQGQENIERTKEHSSIEDMPITADNKAPRAIDYYSVQTLLQILLIGGLYGINTVNEDRQKNTYIRLKSAPVKPMGLLAGKAMGNIAILFLQGILVMLFSKYVYNANWGGSMLINLLVIFIFVVLIIGIGMMIGNIFKSTVVSMMVLWGLMMFFAMTAGAFMTIKQGSIIDKLGRLSPNYYAKTAIFSNIYNSQQSQIYLPILALTLITIVVFSIALIMGRRKIN